jgi:cation transport regulator ChaC
VQEKYVGTVMRYLDEHKIVTGVYCPTWADINLYSNDQTAPTKTKSYIFVANTKHTQYAGSFSND